VSVAIDRPPGEGAIPIPHDPEVATDVGPPTEGPGLDTSAPALGPVGPPPPAAPGSGADRSRRLAATTRLRRAPSDVILLIAVALWALSYTVVKFALREFEPLVLPVFRFGVAGLVLLIILRFREGTIGARREDLARLAVAGFFGVTLTQLTYVYALTFATASDNALIGATAPIVTAVLATIVGLERSGRRYWTAAVIGLVGVVLIVVGSPGGFRLGSGLLGDVLAFATVVTAAVSALLILPLLTRYSVYRVLTYELLLGTAMLVPIALPQLLTQDFSSITRETWAALVYLILATGVLTNLLYVTAMGRIGASRAAIYRYLQSFLGVLFAVLLLGEQVTAIQMIGGAIVVASVMLSRSTRSWNLPAIARLGFAKRR
jgi:drug/metabolite transporter (DMT)-like permease